MGTVRYKLLDCDQGTCGTQLLHRPHSSQPWIISKRGTISLIRIVSNALDSAKRHHNMHKRCVGLLNLIILNLIIKEEQQQAQ